MPPIKRRENRAYKKGGAYKDYRKFVIICEGLREASYFNFFHEKYQKLVVEILEPSEEFHGHSAPQKLSERAGQYIQNEQWDESIGDELWFVVDTDRWQNELHDLSHLCNSTKNWFLANSNPCFEVWLYYHLHCQRITQTNSQEMKRILSNQRAGGYNLQDYIMSIENAVQCSSGLDDHPEQSIADIGITKVYQLGSKILELLPRINGNLDL